MKIVFFGTSNVALPVLEGLHRHHDIAAVVTTPDAVVGRKKVLTESPVSVLAREMELKVLKPQNPKTDESFKQELSSLNADIFIVVSYGKVLPIDVINIPKLKTLNIHFSKLPKYRGASPLQSALYNGDNQTAVSIFVLDEELDHGPIVAMEEFVIDPDDNFLSLSTRLAQESAKLLLNVLPEYASGKINPLPQDETLATKSKIITKQDGKVDWNRTAQEIYNQFRAYYPWPGVWTTWNGKNLKLTDIQVSSEVSSQPGVVSSNGNVGCGQGTVLKIKSLQLEGKNEIAVADFLNGYKDFIGNKLQ